MDVRSHYWNSEVIFITKTSFFCEIRVIIVFVARTSCPSAPRETHVIMNRPTRIQNRFRKRPQPPKQHERSQAGGSSFRDRLLAAWKRFQYRQIQRAITNYSPEKHFLSSRFRPVVGQATMRMVLGEIERNKLPFYADQTRPWLDGAASVCVSGPAVNGSQAGGPVPGHELPKSLRGPRSLLEGSSIETTAQVAPIVFDLVGQKID